MNFNVFSVLKHTKKELGQYPAILTLHLVNNPDRLTRNSFQISLFISKMGLDLIPRVDGEVVDADSTSIVELYKAVSFILLTHLMIIKGFGGKRALEIFG